MNTKPFTPAHKHVGDEGKPGQIVNTLGDYLHMKYGFDRHAYLKTSNAEPVKKKLTFDEWWNLNWYRCTAASTETAKAIWKAAQENV